MYTLNVTLIQCFLDVMLNRIHSVFMALQALCPRIPQILNFPPTVLHTRNKNRNCV